MKDRGGNVLTSKESMLRRWSEYFEGLMNEGNERQKRLDDVGIVNLDTLRAAMERMKSGKAVGRDEISVEARSCLGEMAVSRTRVMC